MDCLYGPYSPQKAQGTNEVANATESNQDTDLIQLVEIALPVNISILMGIALSVNKNKRHRMRYILRCRSKDSQRFLNKATLAWIKAMELL